MDNLNNTGERLVTTFFDNESKTEHLHRYAMAGDYIEDKIVLDIACGEGYGSNLLAQKAKFVFGVDISGEAIAHAGEKYQRNNLRYLEGSAVQIPLGNETVDVVISFETIEHHDKHNEMIVECKRVLKKDGLLIISSPDKKNYSDIPSYHNPFHVKELYEHEFKSLLKLHFGEILFLNQNYFTASLILPINGTKYVKCFDGNFEEVYHNGFFSPLYNIAFASNGVLPEITGSFFTDNSKNPINSSDIVLKFTNSTTWKVGRAIINPILAIKKLFMKNVRRR